MVWRNAILTAAVVALATTTFAQSDDEQPRRERPVDRDPSAFVDRMFERMAEDLNLDEAQRAQFMEATAERRAAARENAGRYAELREAWRSGDTARAEQLRAQMPEWRGPWEGSLEVLDQIEPILREDQLERLDDMRERAERGQRGRENYMRISRELPEQLGLSEEQQAEYDRIAAERRQRFGQRFSEMQPLFEELRAAREAGDEERVTAIREQLEANRPDEDEAAAEFLDDIAPLLDETQRAKLAAFREDLLGPVVVDADGKPTKPLDLRSIFRAAKRVRLEGEQKSELRAIERDMMKADREIERRDREGKAKLAADAQAELEKLFSPEQMHDFQAQLERLSKRSRKPE